MRNYLSTWVFAVLLAIAAVPATAQTRAADRPADAAAIRAHIESIFKAFVEKDRKKLEETHGAEWRGFTPWSGHVIRGRDGYMKEATFPPDMPKDQGMFGWRIGEFDIVFYDDTAVVSFVAEVDRLQGKEKATQKLTLMDVYHKEPGGWMQVASNTSLHPDAVFAIGSDSRRLDPDERASLLKAREAVWRAWFGGDRATLTKLLPPELITIEPGSEKLGTLTSTLDGSREFAAGGGKLVRLVFPTTEIQAYGNTAIIYTSYEMELVTGGKSRTERGMATEVFVQKDGQWLNTGWQLGPITK
jgi:hypothetical protein